MDNCALREPVASRFVSSALHWMWGNTPQLGPPELSGSFWSDLHVMLCMFGNQQYRTMSVSCDLPLLVWQAHA